MYLNRLCDLEFLDYSLRLPGKKQHNILQRNLFVLLSSDELIAQTRLLSILYISAMLPLRYLAGRTHKLAAYNWGAYSMGRAIDIFRDALLMIVTRTSLIVSEIFMMSIFQELRDELPPFKEYYEFTFQPRPMKVVSR